MKHKLVFKEPTQQERKERKQAADQAHREWLAQPKLTAQDRAAWEQRMTPAEREAYLNHLM